MLIIPLVRRKVHQVMKKTALILLAAAIAAGVVIATGSNPKAESVTVLSTNLNSKQLAKSHIFDETQMKVESVVAQKINEKNAIQEAKIREEKENAQKELAAEKKGALKSKEVMNTKGIKISQKDYNILARIVEAEATGHDKKSKRMVANVILNRVEDDHFPDTIESVVFQKLGDHAQFSPISDGRYYSVEVTKETKEAVNEVLAGKDESKGALFFCNRAGSTKSNLQWFDSNLKPLFAYSGHEFFTFK